MPNSNFRPSPSKAPPEGKLPFWKVVYKGRKLQTIWQAGVGACLLLGLVLVPLLVTEVRKKFFNAPTVSYISPEKMQEMVFEHRMSVRNQLEESRKHRAR